MPTDLPPDTGHVSTVVEAGIATVTFGHPRGNALPRAVLRQLADAFEALATRDDVRAIVLRSPGTGPFCAGASFDELRALRDAEEGREFFAGLAHVVLAMRRCPQAVIARVQGKAAGGGVGLAAAADYAIALPGAGVRLSELAVGIGPFVVGPVVERRVGHGHFAAMALDAEWRDAAWAAHAGLYARVVATVGELDEAVAALARRLADANPEAVAALRRAFREGTAHWETLLPERAAISGRLIVTDAAQRALAALAPR